MDIWDDNLEDDGADYSCGFVTFLPKQWDCTAIGSRALKEEDYRTVQGRLPQDGSIQLKHRVLCATHQNVVERDYTA